MLTLGPRIDPDLTSKSRPDHPAGPPLVDPQAAEAAWIIAVGVAVIAAACIGCWLLGVASDVFHG